MIPANVRNSLVSALVFSSAFAFFNFWFAALTSWLSVSDRVSSGSVLSSAGWNKVVDSVIELDNRTANFGSYVNAPGYALSGPITLTTASQSLGQVLSIPTSWTYLVWINARIDINPYSWSHFFLSTTPAGTPLFWYNFFSNPSSAAGLPYLATEYSNMGVLVTSGATNIYLWAMNGSGTLSGMWWTQTTAGYLRLK